MIYDARSDCVDTPSSRLRCAPARVIYTYEITHRYRCFCLDVFFRSFSLICLNYIRIYDIIVNTEELCAICCASFQWYLRGVLFFSNKNWFFAFARSSYCHHSQSFLYRDEMMLDTFLRQATFHAHDVDPCPFVHIATQVKQNRLKNK